MDYRALAGELSGDPLGRGYAGMTDAQAVGSLNAVNRAVNRSSVTGDEAFQSTDSANFAALTDAKRQLWLAFCGRETIDPFAAANVAFVQWVFGAGAQTVTNLGALRVRQVSRAVELGLGEVRASDVAKARAR